IDRGKENKETETVEYSFKVTNLDEELPAEVFLSAGPNPSHDFVIKLDTEEIPYTTIKESEKPNKKKVYDDGQYSVDADFGVMKNYMEEGAVIDIEKGVYIVIVTFKMTDFIDGFKVKDEEIDRGKENKEAGTVEYSFEVTDLDEEIPAEVFLSAGPNPSHEFSIILDTSNIPYEMVEIEETEEGNPGKPGEQGEPGTPGEQGEPGKPGDKGEPGADGKDGKDGKDGQDGQDGRDGQNGQDGTLGSGNNGGNGTTGGTQGTDGSTSAGVSPEANPKTSDNAPILLLSIILLGSGIVAFRKIALR